MSEIIITGKKPLIYNNQLQDFEKYAIEAHESTNHYYDEYLPYSFHLRMVVKNGKDFLGLIEDGLWADTLMALWGHDLVEDARQSYNDVKKRSNTYVAEIVRACTNLGRGRNRKERMPDYIYEDIRTTPGALFVKLCDRMANVQYSKMTGSDKFEMYQKEHAHFKKMLYTPGVLEPMWEYLEKLFND
jgi:(p)ppGpp synthase/HD superfamily hydrolase